ncbi:hypothetical protein LTR17_002776 [Elasticomyces elasticus]|nr:hypothetical protein LTR17_002776 [Elasticomyces elasticus]
MLLTAVKFESKIIYEETMKQAVAVDRRYAGISSTPEYNPNYFADHGEQDLHAMLARHVRDCSATSEQVHKDLRHIEPTLCNKIGVTKDIGIAIFREWVVNEVVNESNGRGLLTLLNRNYDISSAMGGWSAGDWQNELNLPFGHFYRVVECCFQHASTLAIKVFEESNTVKGNAVVTATSPYKPQKQYLTCLHFGTNNTNYEYPWSGNAKIAKYVM